MNDDQFATNIVRQALNDLQHEQTCTPEQKAWFTLLHEEQALDNPDHLYQHLANNIR